MNFIEPLYEKLETWAISIVKMIPNLGLALLVLIGFIVGAKLIRKGFVKLLGKTYENTEMTKILSRILYIAIIAAGAMTALSILHLDKTVTSVLAGVGIVGLALGFAFQDMAANFVSGFMMAAKKPFEIGDVIEIEGFKGTVINIALRSTELMTLEGNEVVIPNRLLYENPLINYYRTKERRIQLGVGVSYGDDLELVQRITEEAIEKVPNYIKEKDIQVIFTEFGDSSINLEVRYWVPYETYYEYLQGLSNGIMEIKKAYDANDIMIPFPIRTLDFGIKGGEKLSEVMPDSSASKGDYESEAAE